MERDGGIARDFNQAERRLLGDNRDEIPVEELDICGAFQRAHQRRATVNEMQAEVEHLSNQELGQLALLRAEAELDYSIVQGMAEKVADTWLFEDF